MFFFYCLILGSILLLAFFLLGKNIKWSIWSNSTFECGYSSYFFSRSSFSMHYFTLGLIFLFLDLELCFMMPLFNEEMASIQGMVNLTVFTAILTAGLLEEWRSKELEWKF